MPLVSPVIVNGLAVPMMVMLPGLAVTVYEVIGLPPFEAGGRKFPAADYWIAPKDEQQLILRQGSNGEEVLIPYAGRLAQQKPAIEEPQLVFDMVGNFEPSYTEYVTDYVLAELWLPGADGFLVRAMKGAHQHQTVKGQSAKK